MTDPTTLSELTALIGQAHEARMNGNLVLARALQGQIDAWYAALQRAIDQRTAGSSRSWRMRHDRPTNEFS
jgi:hypothetical protein